MRTAILAFAAGAWLALAGAAQESSKDALRQSLKDTDLEGDWIYDDVAAGFARARATGKPLLIVFR
jgi:hypothetical protein